VTDCQKSRRETGCLGKAAMFRLSLADINDGD
jgi:hypothetical protein